MKLITRDTDYALRALCYIEKHGDSLVTAAGLVNALRIPRPFLRKILQKMQKGGVLRSYKGKSGGFELARDARDILLTDIMRIFQGPLQLNECIFKKRLCPHRGSCALRDTITRIEDKVIGELRAVTLAHLCKERNASNAKT